MKNLPYALSALVAVLAIAGFASAATAAPSAGARVSIASTRLGRILVDGRGHTLYLFAKDARGMSACNGACAGFWPPLLATGKSIAGPGVKPALLGTTRRSDGRLQITYNHHPLYTFAKDAHKGDTNGEGLDVFGAHWYAVSSAGAGVASPSAASTGNSNSYGSYGGYGY